MRFPYLRQRYRRVRTLARACVTAGALTACTKSDLQSELDRTRSWTATTRLAADRRADGAINEAVTTQLIQRVEQAVSTEEKAFATLATSESDRAAARDVLDSLRQGIHHLQQVVR